MTKQEFLAASLPNELKYKCVKGEIKELLSIGIRSGIINGSRNNNTNSVIPIIRNLDSLTKECVQADYNYGKPFIPIVEIEKLSVEGVEDLIENSIEAINYFIDNDNFSRMEFLPYIIIQQLIRWHFWPNKPEGEEVVYVSETFNPYK